MMVETNKAFDQQTVSAHTLSFIRSCAKSMTLCSETDLQKDMVSVFSAHLKNIKPKDFTPNPLPALGNLQWVKDMKLAKDFREFANFLPWQHSPRMIDYGKTSAVLNFGRMFEMGSIINGLIYIDAYQVYQEHNHPQHEMYFLISGTGCWRWGGHYDYKPITAGNVIYNYPWNWHGIKAGPAPVLAMFLLT